ncbi:hypothetical protein DNK49_19565 [Azoarcus communis]|uniref:Uncharacterized protein n=1 Tax=Parazoarcus communis SWub3 = DSM 12120 TaxID=1121029 RepID=A0A323V429_9RHOO|nr:hypothetical protein DNK49_19565 [Azoarcus communis] [Parazoarcus communis SWub3 = DSM 12120]
MRRAIAHDATTTIDYACATRTGYRRSKNVDVSCIVTQDHIVIPGNALWIFLPKFSAPHSRNLGKARIFN